MQLPEDLFPNSNFPPPEENYKVNFVLCLHIDCSCIFVHHLFIYLLLFTINIMKMVTMMMMPEFLSCLLLPG